ncbi:acyltransferase family protein [Agrobacterium tumefaciens]|uniref:acyltransferase family protein n=1 Tax=Agrobacterium tumefaciens TaxID=358 RepID=UPI001CC08834|nr:acyltransferase [Agrobacterium tumefaciens]MDP9875629.1 peptidoglycan/LPS O-acetylase OafA/YrhL [Agrobacterium tumefaciens]MDP9980544.1 peptidoglycan/LPS O-acetylase OafA/YrhL [Agrobacterium tumefaciens]
MSIETAGFPRSQAASVDYSILRPLSTDDYVVAEKVRHFYGMDVLRSLAAVVILVWHYNHFFNNNAAFVRTDQPLYWLLMPLYEYGYWAVGGFWVISGFVFSHVYSGKSAKASDFIAARFARLYPLHLITLIVIGLAQIVSFKLLGHYTMVAGNSGTDFVRHLFFIAGWGFTEAVNFNGPIWSVSVELAIYAVFFVLARRIFAFGLLTSAFIVVSMSLLLNEQSPINNFHLCAFFFFSGCILYYWLAKFRDNPIVLFTPAILSLAAFVYYVAAGLLPQMRFYNVQFFLFPPIVLLVGWLDFKPSVQARLKPLKWFGDTTYSSYLWHFPIQVMILIAFSYFEIGTTIFESSITLMVWVAGMVAISHFSFIHIERPLQKLCQAAYARAWASAPRN